MHPSSSPEIDARIKTYLQSQNRTFATQWLNSISFELSDAEEAVWALFPHRYLADWFDLHWKDLVQTFLAKELPSVRRLQYRIVSSQAADRGKRAFQPYAQDGKHSFENFFYNNRNHFTLVSLQELIQNQATHFNPVLLFGERGTGKTHLLRAVGNAYLDRDPECTVLFLPFKDIDNEPGKVSLLSCPKCSRLLIDDVDRIESHDRLQQELTALFDLCLAEGVQMFFSSTGRVASSHFVDPALASRLGSGLTLQLKRPDLDIRLQFIREQCRSRDLPLSDEQMLLLGKHLTDLQRIEAVLIKLTAQSDLKNNLPSEIEKLLSREIAKAGNGLTPQVVIEVVAEHWKLCSQDLTSAQRAQKISEARQVAMFLCRQLLRMSSSQIGQAFGGRDHSTVLYSIKKIKRNQINSVDFKNMLKVLQQRCRQRGEAGSQ
jgi:chromosomal replication initiator protein